MTVTRAWAWLIGLSVASTAVAATGLSGHWLALAVLPLAWAKAQIILNRYLHLSQAPAIARGFALVLALFMALLAGLAILPGAMQG
jgi:hypothetical protein